MYGIFDVDFDQLTVDHLRAFLADADEEGVTWEAKADHPEGKSGGQLRSERIQRSVCALANQVGGHLLVGATRTGNEWSLPGVLVPGDEPELWLDKALGALQPKPRCRRKMWPVGEGRVAAVVEVEPLTQTPCMTRDGQVFERVSSESVRVTDPVRLAELMRRGERARTEAERRASRAADELVKYPDIWAQWSVSLVVAMSAASYEPDIAGRLFHERYNRLLKAQARARLFPEDAPVAVPDELRSRIRQSYVQGALGVPDLQWVVRANWDGSVAVNALFAGEVLEHYPFISLLVAPAWSLCADLVEAAGGYGDSRLHLHVQTVQREDAGKTRFDPEEQTHVQVGDPPPRQTVYAGLPGDTVIERWGYVAGPTSEDLGSVQREFLRAAGKWSFEGQPEPPG